VGKTICDHAYSIQPLKPRNERLLGQRIHCPAIAQRVFARLCAKFPFINYWIANVRVAIERRPAWLTGRPNKYPIDFSRIFRWSRMESQRNHGICILFLLYHLAFERQAWENDATLKIKNIGRTALIFDDQKTPCLCWSAKKHVLNGAQMEYDPVDCQQNCPGKT
jgi:hypothetical protein